MGLILSQQDLDGLPSPLGRDRSMFFPNPELVPMGAISAATTCQTATGRTLRVHPVTIVRISPRLEARVLGLLPSETGRACRLPVVERYERVGDGWEWAPLDEAATQLFAGAVLRQLPPDLQRSWSLEWCIGNVKERG